MLRHSVSIKKLFTLFQNLAEGIGCWGTPTLSLKLNENIKYFNNNIISLSGNWTYILLAVTRRTTVPQLAYISYNNKKYVLFFSFTRYPE